MNWNRRDFFKRAAAFAGVAAAGAASLSRQARGQEQHDGDHVMPEMDQPEMEHDGMAGAAMAGGEDYLGGQGSMMFMRGHNMIGAFTEPPGAPADDEVDYRTFRLNFEIAEHELLPGITFKAFAFNGQIPGPEFRVQEGEWIKVEATNRTEEMHTIHWHGVDVPYTMDGVPMITQDPIHPGETFVASERGGVQTVLDLDGVGEGAGALEGKRFGLEDEVGGAQIGFAPRSGAQPHGHVAAGLFVEEV